MSEIANINEARTFARWAAFWSIARFAIDDPFLANLTGGQPTDVAESLAISLEFANDGHSVFEDEAEKDAAVELRNAIRQLKDSEWNNDFATLRDSEPGRYVGQLAAAAVYKMMVSGMPAYPASDSGMP